MAEGFGFQTLQQCSTLFQPWRGQTGCGEEGQGGGTRTRGGRGPTKPAFENPKLGFVFSKPGFVAPKPGFGAGGAETGRWIAGREGAEAAKICGFIGSLGANAGICADRQEVGGRIFPVFPVLKAILFKNPRFHRGFSPFRPKFSTDGVSA